MPLTERSDDNFFTNLKKPIIEVEGDKDELYYDGKKLPTIGYGFNVQVKDNLKIVCNELYQDPTMSQKEIDNLYIVIDKVSPKTNTNLRQAVENHLKPILKDDKKSRKFGEFKFSTSTQKDNVFSTLLETFRNSLDPKLQSISNCPISVQGSKITSASSGSKEYVALMSLTYNNPNLVGDTLKKAIREKNRFKAWYLIRYRINKEDIIGIAKRRFIESNKFGLFEDDEISTKLEDENNDLSQIDVNKIGLKECIDIFKLLNIEKDPYDGQRTYCQYIKYYEKERSFNGNTIPEYMKKHTELNKPYKGREYDKLLKLFADSLNNLLKDVTDKKFTLENIYCVNLKDKGTSNASEINKRLADRNEKGDFKSDKKTDILIMIPKATITPVCIEQPKNTHFTILLGKDAHFDCDKLEIDEKDGTSELILTDYDEKANQRNEDIKFENAKTKNEQTMYMNENSVYTTQDNKFSFDLEKILNQYFFDSLNFKLSNFARENNYTIMAQRATSTFGIELKTLEDKDKINTQSSGNFDLTLTNLIIEDELGDPTEVSEVYLHNSEDKKVYKSYYLEKNDDWQTTHSYTAKFKIYLILDESQKAFKETTKLIIYPDNLRENNFSTEEIHKMQNTGVASLNPNDKRAGSATFDMQISMKNIVHQITNVTSSEKPNFKTDQDINIKVHYKANEKYNDYKDVRYAYTVIKTSEYKNALASGKKDNLTELNKNGKNIVINPAKDIKKEDLKKLEDGGYSLIIFAYLNSPAYKTRYGTTHIRFEFRIPLYLKFKDNKLMIYEFEKLSDDDKFDASLGESATCDIDRSNQIPGGTYYISSNLSISDNSTIYKDKILQDPYIKKKNKSSVDTYKIYVGNVNKIPTSNKLAAPKGINLLDEANKNKFLQAFNETKTRVGVKDDKSVKFIVESGNNNWHDPIDNPQIAIYMQSGGRMAKWASFGKTRGSSNHQGIDLFAISGTPVYACLDGTIHALSTTNRAGTGLFVVLKLSSNSLEYFRAQRREYSLPYRGGGELSSGDKFDMNSDTIYIRYLHLSSVDVTLNQAVRAGDIIGYSGTTGIKGGTCGPHVHFEIMSDRYEGRGISYRVNPGYYLRYKREPAKNENLPTEETLNNSEIKIQTDRKNKGKIND